MFTAAQEVEISGGTMISASNVTINHGPPPRHEQHSTSTWEGNIRNISVAAQQQTRSSEQVYYDNLIVKGRGIPLWYPDPPLNFPEDYRRQGISIGDVGIFSSSGNFTFFFNICHARNAEINSRGVPEQFEPIKPPISTSQISILKDEGNCVASQSVLMSTGWVHLL